MRKVVINLIIFASIVNADVEISLKEGWNLVGLGIETTHEELKAQKMVDATYTYKNQGWQSNGKIDADDGVWIRSKKEFKLVLKNKIRDQRVDEISLKKGWNLKALPINSIISPKIFENTILVWKYKDGKWFKFSKNIDKNYPIFENIGFGEGFWVYSDKNMIIKVSDEESRLTNFANKEMMQEHLLAMIRYSQNYYHKDSTKYPMTPQLTTQQELTTTTAQTSDKAQSNITDTTSTNIQEIGVDEADIIKHDGNNIFYLSNYNLPAIYVNSFLNLLENNGTKPITKIDLKKMPSEFYLVDNKLIVLYPTNNYFWGLWGKVDFNVWSNKSQIEVYDVSDIKNIKLKHSIEIDGNIVDSRITNNKLYLATRFLPYIMVEYPRIYDINCTKPIGIEPISMQDRMIINPNFCYYPKDEKGYFRFDYDHPIEKEYVLTPYISIDGNKSELIAPENFYAPYKLKQYPYITTITSFDLNDFNKKDHVSIVGNSSTLYANNKAIYLVSNEYPIYFSFKDYKERLVIHKIAIDSKLEYKAKGYVDGRILNQFSLSEYDDILRVAITEGFSWMDNTKNSIVTLKENNGTLELLGILDNIGKEGESIQGVRFLGQKAFVVTFKRTDPFYTIDLSDPKNPKKIGELSIPGYSSYFHPVDESLILSIGRDADNEGRNLGIQIQLFDISDFANPKLANKIVIGTSYTHSEALNTHKAFTYRNSDRVFAIPISNYIGINKAQEVSYEYYLDIYEISNKEIKKLTKVDANTSSNFYINQRSIIFNNAQKRYAIYLNGDILYLKEF